VDPLDALARREALFHQQLQNELPIAALPGRVPQEFLTKSIFDLSLRFPFFAKRGRGRAFQALEAAISDCQHLNANWLEKLVLCVLLRF